MFSALTYSGPEAPLPAVDRVFDTVVKKSPRRGDTVYVDDRIFLAFPPPYLEHYKRLRGVLVKKVSDKPDELWWEQET